MPTHLRIQNCLAFEQIYTRCARSVVECSVRIKFSSTTVLHDDNDDISLNTVYITHSNVFLTDRAKAAALAESIILASMP